MGILNIQRAVKTLGVEPVVFKPSERRLLDLYRTFLLRAGEFCSPCNIMIGAAANRLALQNGIRLIALGGVLDYLMNRKWGFSETTGGIWTTTAGSFSRSIINRTQHQRSTRRRFNARHFSSLTIQREMHFPHSLGLLYSAFTYFTGFRVNSAEHQEGCRAGR
jgi:hypothetical protein